MATVAPGTPAHLPVMLAPVLEALAPRDGGVYVDGTFGAGGYARGILAAASTRVIALDRDPDAVAAGRAAEAASGGRLAVVLGCFGDMQALVSPYCEAWAATPDGIVLDLGVSSMQLDAAARGFSFRRDGPLDMRMDAGTGDTPSAADIVNTYAPHDLARIFKVLGEERHARRIAQTIARRRTAKPFARTGDLADLVADALPAAARGTPRRIHPATRVFQALRMYVNDELGELARGLAAAETLLAQGGRLVVVSFHSLEDRMVKRFFAARSGAAAKPSRHLPHSPEMAPAWQLITRKPLTPSDNEIRHNPRARSARLRAAARTAAPAYGGDEGALAALGLPPRKPATIGAGAAP